MSCFWGTMHDKQNKIMDDERITCVVVRFFCRHMFGRSCWRQVLCIKIIR